MKVTFLDEPDLEFAYATPHIDPRTGIANYGTADVNAFSRPRNLRVGIVGPAKHIDALCQWLERCRGEIQGKESHLKTLFADFPGFNEETAFRSRLDLDDRLLRPINERELRGLKDLLPDVAARQAADLYLAQLNLLSEEARCDVVICTRPDDLPEHAAVFERPEPGEPFHLQTTFHDLLKAKAMGFHFPLQVIKRETWDESYRPKRVQQGEVRRSRQDEATRAWNLHVAMYYKAGGTPWRLVRGNDRTTCYVGVAFYRSDGTGVLHTSVAQIFNELGDGVIVRGAQVRVTRRDPQPHLGFDDARALLVSAVQRYRDEHGHAPARVVVHKTSSYTRDERRGFLAAVEDERLSSSELIWLPGRDSVRLLRTGANPPLRGTMLSLEEDRHILYTRGSVPFYKCYPGMYVPQALGIRLVDVESSPEFLAQEILALTKMNWNQTQLDGRIPITLRTADSVGDILRHVEAGAAMARRYAYYM